MLEARTSGWLGLLLVGKTLEDEVAQGNARFVLKRMSLVPSQPSRHGEGRMCSFKKKNKMPGRKEEPCILALPLPPRSHRPSLHLDASPQL